jgi:hypothetical protein
MSESNYFGPCSRYGEEERAYGDVLLVIYGSLAGLLIIMAIAAAARRRP